MKLLSPNYISPLPTQGQFENVFIEETCIIHKRIEKYLVIKFEMYYFKNSVKITLSEKLMEFYGTDEDTITSNQTAFCKKLNPLYDENNLESTEPEFLFFPLLQILYENSGQLPVEYEISDFGYPNYTDVLQYFVGGYFENPEILIENPLAQGFLLTKLFMNNEPVINQFTFVTNE